ncbi:hypothetical protein SRABI128_05980 [Microbacterium sp. Bi128]|nr:hypothetical protein SRABI128_05980 [Microbacterium sp. Bi128]
MPQGAAKSWPQWNSPANPVRGLVRSPNGDEGTSDSSGAMRKPTAGRCRDAEATLSSPRTPARVAVSTVLRLKATSAWASAVTAPAPGVPAGAVAAEWASGSRASGPTSPEAGMAAVGTAVGAP